jgi:hypothetical protein
MKSGLRRTSIPCLNRASVNKADAVNKDWLNIEGGIEDIVGMWHKALA